MDYSVVIKNLGKRYKEVTALDGINLNVPEGKIFSIIGPNGAGKTTLIKCLVGLTTPTVGSLTVAGLDPIKDKTSLCKLIGYMPQEPTLYEDLSARNNVRFFAKAIMPNEVKDRVSEVLNFVELSHRANHRIHTFSSGMKKRVSLACTLVHQPKILFLDEPTAGIDPELKQKLWKMFKTLAKQGVTLFISTNLIEETIYCDQIAILKEGNLIHISSPQEFKQEGSTHVKITLESGKVIEEKISADTNALTQLLRKYGLNKKVKQIEEERESLDEIMQKTFKKFK